MNIREYTDKHFGKVDFNVKGAWVEDLKVFDPKSLVEADLDGYRAFTLEEIDFLNNVFGRCPAEITRSWVDVIGVEENQMARSERLDWMRR